MKDEWWRMKDGGWRCRWREMKMKDEGWMMKDEDADEERWKWRMNEGWDRKNEGLPITAGASLPSGSKQYFRPLFIKDPSSTF